jgi:hypothetical protein
MGKKAIGAMSNATGTKNENADARDDITVLATNCSPIQTPQAWKRQVPVQDVHGSFDDKIPSPDSMNLPRNFDSWR